MGVALLRVCEAVVMRADLIMAGDHSGWRCLNSAAIPAMCGLDIDVPWKKSKFFPPSVGVTGETAARTARPGAMMSGFSMSPPDARAGPREENDATSGASAPP